MQPANDNYWYCAALYEATRRMERLARDIYQMKSKKPDYTETLK